MLQNIICFKHLSKYHSKFKSKLRHKEPAKVYNLVSDTDKEYSKLLKFRLKYLPLQFKKIENKQQNNFCYEGQKEIGRCRGVQEIQIYNEENPHYYDCDNKKMLGRILSEVQNEYYALCEIANETPNQSKKNQQELLKKLKMEIVEAKDLEKGDFSEQYCKENNCIMARDRQGKLVECGSQIDTVNEISYKNQIFLQPQQYCRKTMSPNEKYELEFHKKPFFRDYSYQIGFDQTMLITCQHLQCPNGKVDRIGYAILGKQKHLNKKPKSETEKNSIQNETTQMVEEKSLDFEYSYRCHQDLTIYLNKLCKEQNECEVKAKSDLWQQKDQVQNKTTHEDGDCKKIQENDDDQLRLNVIATCMCVLNVADIDEEYVKAQEC